MWATGKNNVTIVDDGTSSNETRLGAVKDIQYAVKKCALDDELFVMAGDNLLSFSLKEYFDYFDTKDTSCIMRYEELDERRLRKCGVVEVDESDRVLSMEEKPAIPRSHWVCPPFYIYKRDDLRLLDESIDSGCGVDAPGSLVAWLCSRVPVHAWEMPGPRYDIGNLESYQTVQELFG